MARLDSTSSVGSKLTHVKMPASWNAFSALIRSPGKAAAFSHFKEKASSRLVRVEAKASRLGVNKSEARKALVPVVVQVQSAIACTSDASIPWRGKVVSPRWLGSVVKLSIA